MSILFSKKIEKVLKALSLNGFGEFWPCAHAHIHYIYKKGTVKIFPFCPPGKLCHVFNFVQPAQIFLPFLYYYYSICNHLLSTTNSKSCIRQPVCFCASCPACQKTGQKFVQLFHSSNCTKFRPDFCWLCRSRLLPHQGASRARAFLIGPLYSKGWRLLFRRPILSSQEVALWITDRAPILELEEVNYTL